MLRARAPRSGETWTPRFQLGSRESRIGVPVPCSFVSGQTRARLGAPIFVGRWRVRANAADFEPARNGAEATSLARPLHSIRFRQPGGRLREEIVMMNRPWKTRGWRGPCVAVLLVACSAV